MVTKKKVKKKAKKKAVRRGGPPKKNTRSPREKQIVKLVAKHMTMQEIADKLGISYNTVKRYLDRIRNFLKIRRKSEIAMWAIQNKGKLRIR